MGYKQSISNAGRESTMIHVPGLSYVASCGLVLFIRCMPWRRLSISASGSLVFLGIYQDSVECVSEAKAFLSLNACSKRDIPPIE